jgi:hypothetical protein
VCRLVAAAHAHRQAQWQVGNGFLGLPNRNGMAKLQNPARGPTGSVWGSARLGIGIWRRWARQARIERWARQARIETARSVGPDSTRVIRDGSAAEGRCVRATYALRHAARRAWQLDGLSCAPESGRVHHGTCGRAAHATTTSNRPVHLRVTAWSCCAMRPSLACAARPPANGVRRGAAPRWPRSSRAPAAAKRAG